MKYKPLVIGELTAKVPIVQGGMGVGISLGGLAGAVAKEGGIGIISAAQIGFKDPEFEKNPFKVNLEAIKKELAKAREIAPKGIVGFNIMVALKHYSEYVKEAVKAGADIIISGAGLPTDLPEYVKGFKTKIAPIVSTEKSAKVILKFWDKKYNRTADMVVIEGPKAGGHLGFNEKQLAYFNEEAYKEEVQSIRRAVREYEEKYDCQIPIVLAGGIYTKADMEEAMNQEIQGVQIGSRFVTTVECDASDAYKQAYLDATEQEVQIVKSPVGMPGRAILNPFMEKVMSGEKITPQKCLGCLQKCSPKEIPYCITDALVNAAKGDTDEALLFCGEKAYCATRIETVKEVINSLIEE